MALWMVDTNVLLRSVQLESPDYTLACKTIDSLAGARDEMCVVPQVIAEFWSVATRPSDVNGLGWTTEEKMNEVSAILSRFVLLSDLPIAFLFWLDLVKKHEVKGKRVHDARLAAVMQAHGVENLLTFNVDDFAAFQHIKAVHPADVEAS